MPHQPSDLSMVKRMEIQNVTLFYTIIFKPGLAVFIVF